jgi:broad specificity phosphatase PhoE
MGGRSHHGKNVRAQGCTTPFGSLTEVLGILLSLSRDDERNGMILIRHGQTEFNRVFSATRCDPGIRDPNLTHLGRCQAATAARALRPSSLRKLITSPYARALETAVIIAEHLNLPITVEPLIAERFFFTCDIGSPLATLRGRWPNIVFDHLQDPWWPRQDETEEMVLRRSETFRRQIASEAWSDIAVITHWGFIRALTGLKVPNGAVLRIDPTRPDRVAEVVLMPEAG